MKERETEIKLTQREKEIIEAGIEYTMKKRPNMLAGDMFSEEMREYNRNKHFEKGAKWADKTMVERMCRCFCDVLCEKGMSGMCYYKHDYLQQTKNTFKYNECNKLKIIRKATEE